MQRYMCVATVAYLGEGVGVGVEALGDAHGVHASHDLFQARTDLRRILTRFLFFPCTRHASRGVHADDIDMRRVDTYGFLEVHIGHVECNS